VPSAEKIALDKVHNVSDKEAVKTLTVTLHASVPVPLDAKTLT